LFESGPLSVQINEVKTTNNVLKV